MGFTASKLTRLSGGAPAVPRLALLLLLFPFFFAGQAKAATNAPPAKLSVSGYGFFGNRQLKNLLSVLQKPGAKPAFFEANYVEDAILVLFSRLNRDGYLHPIILAIAKTPEAGKQTFTWTAPLGEPLPRPFQARRLEFLIEQGVL